MDINRAAEILQNVASGIDPMTGKTLPSDSLYNDPDIIRALFICVQYIRGQQQPTEKVKMPLEEEQAVNLGKGLPKNAGLPWTDDLKRELASDFKAGHSPAALADRFGRSKGAITSELKRQGLISEEEERNL